VRTPLSAKLLHPAWQMPAIRARYPHFLMRAMIRIAKSAQGLSVVNALVKCGGPADSRMIAALFDALHDPDKYVRQTVAYALAECADAGGYEQVLPALIEALDDPYDQVGIGVTKSLAKCGDPRAISALVRAAMTNNIEQVRSFSRSALEGLGAASGRIIREAAAQASSLPLARGISLLAQIKDEQDFPFFIESTKNQDPEVRRSAVWALNDKRALQALPVLIECLHDSVLRVREAAIETLGNIGDPAAIPHLIECLQDEELAKSAASSLKGIETREARLAVGTWKNRRA
jgi:HEAT repeat protein